MHKKCNLFRWRHLDHWHPIVSIHVQAVFSVVPGQDDLFLHILPDLGLDGDPGADGEIVLRTRSSVLCQGLRLLSLGDRRGGHARAHRWAGEKCQDPTMCQALQTFGSMVDKHLVVVEDLLSVQCKADQAESLVAWTFGTFFLKIRDFPIVLPSSIQFSANEGKKPISADLTV